jgi:atypical dual specificity phosphatase
MTALSRILIRLSYYPSVAFNRLMCGLHVWNHWDWIDPYILLGAVPARRHIPELYGLGIRTILNLCEEFPGYPAEMNAVGIRQFHVPTPDYHCPCEATLLRGMRILHAEVGARRKTFVHCKAGQGRSATLVLCYLMAARSMTAAAAYRHIKAIRSHLARRLDRRAPVEAIERALREGSLSLDAAGGPR